MLPTPLKKSSSPHPGVWLRRRTGCAPLPLFWRQNSRESGDAKNRSLRTSRTANAQAELEGRQKISHPPKPPAARFACKIADRPTLRGARENCRSFRRRQPRRSYISSPPAPPLQTNSNPSPASAGIGAPRSIPERTHPRRLRPRPTPYAAAPTASLVVAALSSNFSDLLSFQRLRAPPAPPPC